MGEAHAVFFTGARSYPPRPGVESELRCVLSFFACAMGVGGYGGHGVFLRIHKD
jgi:hypothetical protein